MNIILASASPRRAELLKKQGIDFTVVPSAIEEKVDPNHSPYENARRIAVQKARHVSCDNPGKLVVAADTMVVLDGLIIGKPMDREDARRMLAMLSGKEHEVVTGLALAHVSDGYNFSTTEVSRVRFGKISDDAIAEYVAGSEPLDKAGAYAIQGRAGEWVVSYRGSYSNIIGLPMETLVETLENIGYMSSEEK